MRVNRKTSSNVRSAGGRKSLDWEKRCRRIENELTYRLDFERLIISISNRFIALQPAEVDAGIQRALKELGEFVKVDRTYLFLFSDDFFDYSNTHEWCAPGIQPEKDNLQGLKTDDIKWWVSQLRRGAAIHVPRIGRMPPEAENERRILEAQNIKSLLVVPLLLGGELLGFAGFDSVRREKKWQEEHIALLRISADILVNALERRKAEISNRVFRYRLQRARKLEIAGRLAGGLAHDFNNLLLGIVGLSDLIIDRLKPSSAIRSDILEIKKAGERATALANQLLTFSRMRVVQPRPLNLNFRIQEMENFLRRLAGDQVTLKFKLAPRLHTVRIDPVGVEQIVLNLVLNARDAMSGGGVMTITTSNVVFEPDNHAGGAARTGRFVSLSVSDTGGGIRKEAQMHLFDPFFTTKETGLGLGLTSVASIVEEHNGWVDFSTEAGRGTIFRVFLPALPAPTLSREEKSRRTEDIKGNGERILVVDDNKTARFLARRILRRNGYRVNTANGAAAADRIFRKKSKDFDLVFCDVVMPGTNGLELAEKWKRKRPGLKVLFTSGYVDKSGNLEKIRSEKLPFLPKPYNAASLLTAVRESLDAKKEKPRNKKRKK